MATNLFNRSTGTGAPGAAPAASVPGQAPNPQRIPQGGAAPNPMAQNAAVQMYQMRQELNQLTAAVIALQQRTVVHMDFKFTRDPATDRIDGAKMVGKLV